MLKILPVLLLIMVVVTPLQAQDDYQSFYTGSLKIGNTGMYILGSWAMANIAVFAKTIIIGFLLIFGEE